MLSRPDGPVNPRFVSALRISVAVVALLVVAGVVEAQDSRLTGSDFEYLGAFRLECESEACAYNLTDLGSAAAGSLWVTDHVYHYAVRRIAIPEPLVSGVFDDLPQAATLEGPLVTGGCPGDSTDISGVEGIGTEVASTCRDWYNVTGDYGPVYFRRPSAIIEEIGPRSDPFHPNKLGAYLFTLPLDWVAAVDLGSRTMVTGFSREAGANGGSQGPTLFAFDPDDPSHAFDLLWYREIYPGCPYEDGCDFPGYQSADSWLGADWVRAGGSDAILIAGVKSGSTCYGEAAGCGDLCRASKGYHGYPYTAMVLLYDPADVEARLAGTVEPYEIVPYSEWTPDAAFRGRLHDANLFVATGAVVRRKYEIGRRSIGLWVLNRMARRGRYRMQNPAMGEGDTRRERTAASGSPTPVALAPGDGIGPEIMDATLEVIAAAGARIEPCPIEIGEAVYRRGHSSGIDSDGWQTLLATRVLLKGPVTTTQGRGVKSVNVTLRKSLGLFANVRPCVAYDPFIPVRHPHLDVVIVRENEEDLYAGIEHQQTDDVVQCLKLITRPGCEKIARFAFEYAARRGRRKVTCLVKDNIMKLTDGLFRRVFEEVAADYPELGSDHMIVDIGMGRLANAPERFDVIVTPNLYGDILSDIAAEISGSVGLAPSANIGNDFAMFEAIHGSAPDIAGQGIANPSGLILSAAKMLAHIGQGEVATTVHNAWLRGIEDGIHTADIYRQGASRRRVGTEGFARAVIERLGSGPQRLKPMVYADEPMPRIEPKRLDPAAKTLLGIDVFVHWRPGSPDELAQRLQMVAAESMRLQMITNRGVKVWPEGLPETFLTDHWRCRFQPEGATDPVSHRDIIDLLARLEGAGLDFIKTEHLYAFDGRPAFSLGQGQ